MVQKVQGCVPGCWPCRGHRGPAVLGAAGPQAAGTGMELRFWDGMGSCNLIRALAAPSQECCSEEGHREMEPLAGVVWEAETGCAGWGGCLGKA